MKNALLGWRNVKTFRQPFFYFQGTDEYKRNRQNKNPLMKRVFVFFC